MPERYFEDDGKLIIQRTEDMAPYVEAARLAKEAPQQPISDSWHVGRVPAFMVALWLKEAGVKWDDPAARDVLERKLMDGSFSKFRVKEGSFK
jgi:hypothetical protein